jgi:hypothetical protein
MDDNTIMIHAVLSRYLYRRWGKYSRSQFMRQSWAWPARWSGSHPRGWPGATSDYHYLSTFGKCECSERLQ